MNIPTTGNKAYNNPTFSHKKARFILESQFIIAYNSAPIINATTLSKIHNGISLFLSPLQIKTNPTGAKTVNIKAYWSGSPK